MNPSHKRLHTPPGPEVIDRSIGTRQPGEEYGTPHRTSVRAITWWESLKPPGERATQQEIFDKLGVSRRSGYEMLEHELPGTETARTFQNNPLQEDHVRRGPHTKITLSQAQTMEDTLERCGFEARTMTWAQLAEEAEIEDCSTRLIRETMNARGYRMCKACQKPITPRDIGKAWKK